MVCNLFVISGVLTTMYSVVAKFGAEKVVSRFRLSVCLSVVCVYLHRITNRVFIPLRC